MELLIIMGGVCAVFFVIGAIAEAINWIMIRRRPGDTRCLVILDD